MGGSWAEASRRLADVLEELAPRPAAVPAGLLGLECEYKILEDGRPVDFAQLLPDVAAASPVPVRRESERRYRFSTGHLLVADGSYAEIATPPEGLGAGAPTCVAASLAHARRALTAALNTVSASVGRRYEAHGHSTHFNVQTGPYLDSERLAHRYASGYALLMMFLSSVPNVLGLIARPRRDRLEIVTDCVDDDERVRACLAALIGSVLAAYDEETGAAASRIPALPETALIQARIRPGWRVNFAPLTDEECRRIRRVEIPTADGGWVPLQSYLDRIWSVSEPYSARYLASEELGSVRDFVSGARLVPFEDRNGHASRPNPEAVAPDGSSVGGAAYRNALSVRAVDGWRFEPSFVHWDFLALSATRADRSGRSCIVTLPRHMFDRYGSGALDDAIHRALNHVPATTAHGATLSSLGEALTPGVFASIDRRALARDLEQVTRRPRVPAPAESRPRQRRAPKKKPRRRDMVCSVRIAKDGIEIGIPLTMDPLKTLQLPQEPPQNAFAAGHGVWIHNGTFGHYSSDHRVRGLGFDFDFARNYRSSVEYEGTLGLNWDHGYDIRVVPQRPKNARSIPDGWMELFSAYSTSGPLTYYHGTGRKTDHAFVDWEVRRVRWCEDRFDAVVSTYAQNPGEDFEIERYAVLPGFSPPFPLEEPVFYRIRFRHGTRYLLNCHGYVVEIRDKSHNRMYFAYGTPANPKTNYLVLRRIVDTVGREYQLEYKQSSSGQVPRITDLVELGGKHRRVTFEYSNGDMLLTSAKLASGDAGRPELIYTYRQGGRQALLETIVNPAEAAIDRTRYWLKNAYAGATNKERVVGQHVGVPGGVQPQAGGDYRFDYSQPGRVTLTNRDSVETTYIIQTDVVREIRLEDEVYENGQKLAGKRLVTKYEYDANYHIKSRELPSGLMERFEYRNRNALVREGDERDKIPVFTHLNDLSRDDLLTYTVEPIGIGPSLETRYEYERLFNSVKKVTTPTGETVFEYSNGRCATPERNGNPLRIVHPRQARPDGSTRAVIEVFGYGLGGRVVYRRDGDGVQHSFILHETGQIQFHYIGLRPHEYFDYDAVGNILRRQDIRGSEWVLTHDDRDNLRRIVDPMGHATVLTCDLNDRLKTKTVTMQDDANSIPGLTPAPQRTVVETTEYDVLGQVHSLTIDGGGLSKVHRWDHDPEGRVRTEYTPRSTSGERPDARRDYEYNARGQLKTLTTGTQGPRPATASYAYDVDGRLALTVDAAGGEHTTRYDGFGRPIENTGPDGATAYREYDGALLWREWVEGPIDTGLGSAPTSGILRETHFQMDANGRVIARRDLIYDPAQRASVTQVQASATFQGFFTQLRFANLPAATTRTWFTSGGRIEKIETPGRCVTTNHYRFDDWGQLDYVELPNGHRVDYQYDGTLVRTKRTTLKPETGTLMAPAPKDLVIEETRDYDPLGRMLRSIGANKLARDYAYDSLGNKRGEAAPLGVTIAEFDGLSRLVRSEIRGVTSLSNAKGNAVISHGYDLNDNVTSTKDDLGRETVSTFDGQNLVATIKQPYREEVKLTRRADGLISLAEMGSARDLKCGYDHLGRVVSLDSREGGTHSTKAFGYDALGQLTWAHDSNSTATSDRVQTYRTYDSLGRITSERTVVPEHSFDKTVAYGYAANLRQRTIAYPENNPVVDYLMTRDGNIASLKRNGELFLSRLHQGPGRLLESKYAFVLDVSQPQRRYNLDFVESQRYDDVGRANSRSLYLRDGLLSYGRWLQIASTESITYNPTNGAIGTRTSGALRGLPTPPPASATLFHYDGAGRVFLSRETVGADSQLFDHDWDGGNSLHRILETRIQSGTTTQRTTTITYPNTPNDRDRTEIGPDGATDWRFDGEGRLVYMEHRPRVTAIRDYSRQFTYDPCDRLVRVITERVPLDYIERTEARYLYDAFGRLIVRETDSAHGLPDDFRLFFIYDGPRGIAEYGHNKLRRNTYLFDDQGRVVHYRGLSTSELRDFVPVVAADASPWFVLRSRGSLATLPAPSGSTPADRVNYYTQEIPLLVEECRNAPFEENPIIAYDYSSGTIDPRPARRSLIPISTGGRRRFDEESLVYNVHRFYDPALRGFITPDASGNWGDPAALGNAYTYAGNDPVQARDDGNALIAVLYAAVAFGLMAAATDLARQSIQILTDKRDAFDTNELAEWTLTGAMIGAGSVCLPLRLQAIAAGTMLGLGGIQIARDIYNVKQVGWGTVAFDSATLLFPLALPRVRAGAIDLQARYFLWRMARNPDYVPWVMSMEQADAVVALAIEREMPFEAATNEAVDPGRRLFRYRNTRGADYADSVGSPEEGGYRMPSHSHPARRLLHRMPSGKDLERAFQAPPGIERITIFAPRWPRRAGLVRQGPVQRTVADCVVLEDGLHYRVRPENPRDFEEIIHVLSERRLAWWGDDAHTEIVFGRERPNSTSADKLAWDANWAGAGYNRAYRYWERNLVSLDRRIEGRLR